jgi:hypothetical protein
MDGVPEFLRGDDPQPGACRRPGGHQEREEASTNPLSTVENALKLRTPPEPPVLLKPPR